MTSRAGTRWRLWPETSPRTSPGQRRTAPFRPGWAACTGYRSSPSELLARRGDRLPALWLRQIDRPHLGQKRSAEQVVRVHLRRPQGDVQAPSLVNVGRILTLRCRAGPRRGVVVSRAPHLDDSDTAEFPTGGVLLRTSPGYAEHQRHGGPVPAAGALALLRQAIAACETSFGHHQRSLRSRREVVVPRFCQENR
jgi:hypothetical protein